MHAWQTRFWSKVNRTHDGCWEWIAAKTPKGYGWFPNNRGTRRAHRIAWQLLRGNIPVGLYVLHACDNRACVNPDHLFLGTAVDNYNDMRKKGRHVYPQHRKLSADKILQWRILFEKGVLPSWQELARQTGIDRTAIRKAVLGITWSSIS